MGLLQEALDRQIALLPQHIWTEILADKLAALGHADTALAERMAAHLLSGADPNAFDDPAAPGITIVIGEADLERMRARGNSFTERIPGLVEDFIEKSGRSFADAFLAAVKDGRQVERDKSAAFRNRIFRRWGGGLDQLAILLELACEAHSRYATEPAKDAPRGKATLEVLSQLHQRACEVSAEILCLLENGFADGALSRWRTLFELSTYATLISDAGDLLADRYLDHGIVERRKYAHDLAASGPELGIQPPRKSELTPLAAELKAAIAKHGDNFAGPQGWAADFFGNPRPTFRDLQRIANRSEMQIFYKLSSQGIHANAGTAPPSLGLLYERSFVGDANAGLDLPGCAVAYCLTRMIGAAYGNQLDIDDLAMMRAAVLVRDDCCAAFRRANRKLDRDEARARQRIAATAQRQFGTRTKRRPAGSRR